MCLCVCVCLRVFHISLSTGAGRTIAGIRGLFFSSLIFFSSLNFFFLSQQVLDVLLEAGADADAKDGQAQILKSALYGA